MNVRLRSAAARNAPPARAAVLCAALAFAAACEKRPAVDPGQNDPAATAAALDAVQARVEKVTSYALEGTVTEMSSGKTGSFSYALRQPQLLYARLDDAAQTLIFDGKVLTGIDDRNKIVMRQSLEAMDEASRLAALYEIFGVFVPEGWRPPLMRTDPSVLEGRMVTAADPRSPPSWFLTSKLDDDTIAAVRYELHAPRGDFVAKEFVDKQGQVVAFTRVLEQHRDPGTGLSFPKVWERKDASGHVKVALTKIEVNGDVPIERFQPTVPEGYTVRDASGAPPPGAAADGGSP